MAADIEIRRLTHELADLTRQFKKMTNELSGVNRNLTQLNELLKPKEDAIDG